MVGGAGLGEVRGRSGRLGGRGGVERARGGGGRMRGGGVARERVLGRDDGLGVVLDLVLVIEGDDTPNDQNDDSENHDD